MALDSHIFTIVEPKIKLDPMKVPNLGEAETGDANSTMESAVVPYIKINNYTFQQGSLDTFVLDMNGMYPEIRAKIYDSENVFGVDQFPRDGDLLNLRIQLDRNGTYKDIRMDFTILEFKGAPTGNIERSGGKGPMFNIRAIAKIPGMYTDESKSYGNNNSLEHIKLVAEDLKLGVATNVTTTADEMSRFCAYQTKLEFLKDIVDHSYISDDSFQTTSIDPYYYINFVDVQRVFNAPNDIEMHDLMTGAIFSERGTDPKDGDGKEPAQLVLTNNHNARGTNTSILRYNLVNNSTKVALENGYRRKLQYFDYEDTENNLLEFDIESMTSGNVSDREEALKGRRGSDVDEYNTHVKQKYAGIQSSNMHSNYNYAFINNVQNLVELDKMYLEVELEALNPAIYKYMKIPVSIFNYGINNTAVTKEANKQAKDADFELKQEESDLGKIQQDDTGELDKFTVDEFLTAHYVVMGIKYKYSEPDGYTQVLKLARREWPARLSNI